jgi:hypothetical protein
VTTSRAAGGSNLRPRNRLLTLLPDDTFAKISPELRSFAVDQGTVLYGYNQPIPAVWFPNTCVVSWLSEDQQGDVVEVATCGYEGFAGVPLFLGVDRTPGRGLVQISGTIERMEAAVFQELARDPGPFRDLLARYTQALFNHMAQTAVCNRAHPINERCARWLLMTHDRVEGDTFYLTHEFLAQMLGVRRASVTVAAGILQQAGLIRYHRGVVEIVDRDGLEEACCPCYGIVRETFEAILGASTG